MIFLDLLFLTLGPVELVPTEPPFFGFYVFGSISPVIRIMLIFNCIIIPVILLKMKEDPLLNSVCRSQSFFFAILFFFFFIAPRKAALCDTQIVAPPIEFYPAPPAGAEFPEPLSPPPPRPEIPELAQPLMLDQDRRHELAVGVGLQFFGRNAWRDVTQQMDMLSLRMLLETRIEAALIDDGYRAEDLIRKRFEVRDVLFYKRDGQPFSEQTLRRYLSEIDNSGTRSSVPYRKVVRAIRNSDICL